MSGKNTLTQVLLPAFLAYLYIKHTPGKPTYLQKNSIHFCENILAGNFGSTYDNAGIYFFSK